MMRIQYTAALFLLALIAAQQPAPKPDAKPAPIALTEAETREAVAAKTAVEQAYADKNAAWKFACDTDIRNATGATQALGFIHNVQLKINAAEAQERETLWKHRHGCAECVYSDDYKTMVRPGQKAN